MIKQVKILFFMLIVVQGLHSIEEYVGRLWEVLLPAQYLTGLISRDHRMGFLIINISLFGFGLLCWSLLNWKGLDNTKGLIWFWIIIELINGIGHPAWSLYRKSYEPGVVTAPMLLLISILIIRCLVIVDARDQKSP